MLKESVKDSNNNIFHVLLCFRYQLKVTSMSNIIYLISIYTYLKINSSHYKIKSLRGCFHVNKSRKHKKNKIVMEVYEITSILHFF